MHNIQTVDATVFECRETVSFAHGEVSTRFLWRIGGSLAPRHSGRRNGNERHVGRRGSDRAAVSGARESKLLRGRLDAPGHVNTAHNVGSLSRGAYQQCVRYCGTAALLQPHLRRGCSLTAPLASHCFTLLAAAQEETRGEGLRRPPGPMVRGSSLARLARVDFPCLCG